MVDVLCGCILCGCFWTLHTTYNTATHSKQQTPHSNNQQQAAQEPTSQQHTAQHIMHTTGSTLQMTAAHSTHHTTNRTQQQTATGSTATYSTQYSHSQHVPGGWQHGGGHVCLFRIVMLSATDNTQQTADCNKQQQAAHSTRRVHIFVCAAMHACRCVPACTDVYV